MSVTVLTPAVVKRLTTVEQVRADLGLGPDTPSTSQLERFIDQASARAAKFCRRTFARETVRERFEDCRWANSGASWLMLDRTPVVRMVAVTVDGIALDPLAYEIEGRALYLLDGDRRRCWYGRTIIVDYEAGWLLPGESRGSPPVTTAEDLPADVERAVILLVAASLSATGRDAMVKSENVEGVGSTDWYVQGASAALPHPEAEATLSEYRRIAFG